MPIALSAAPTTLPRAEDLARDAATMRAARLPMVVLYSRAGCAYCDQARAHLAPLAQAGASGPPALFRQIDIDADRPLTDFAGARSTHRGVAAQQGVRLTPTVLIFDAEGRALGEAIVGMRLADFYGQYVDNAITAAHHALGANH